MSQIRRRQFLLAVGAGSLLVSLPILAQQEKRLRRIGYYSNGNPQASISWLAGFREGMAEMRWVEGRDYVIDARYGNGDSSDGQGVAAQLVATQPDLLLTPADTSASQLARQTKTIPIVFAVAQDPAGSGVIASLRRPGGNVTGMSALTRDLAAKRLQLLKEAFPRVSHVVVLSDTRNLGNVVTAKEAEAAAPRLGMRVTVIGLRQTTEIEAAFKQGTALGAQAYMVNGSGVINTQRQEIADRIIRLKVPAIFGSTLFSEAGGLMSYAPSDRDNFRRAAGYVDKILKGANPGDLPVEQATNFEMVVNMKTAKAMGIKFPQSILLQATRLIE